MGSKAKDTSSESVDNSKVIADAIACGRAVLDEGKTKKEAAMAIYRVLENCEQQVIVNAFIEGASLTSKGALTYWYNCRRALAAERRKAGEA